MDFKRLRYFATIIEQGSISKAAQVLFMAQPPLSKRLQELEEELGTPLFFRDGKRLVPTRAGEFLYQRACEILRTVEETRRETLEIAATQQRVLRVGVSYLFLQYYMPLIQSLYVRNARAEIAVSVSDSSHLEDLLQRGLIDVALMQRPHSPETFEVTDLPHVGLKLLVSSGLAGTSEASSWHWDALDGLPLILLRRVEGAGTFEGILDHLRKAGVHPAVKMYVSDPVVAVQMLERGVEGAAFLPASEVIPSSSGAYRIFDLDPSPLLFAPAAVRLSTNADLPEVLDVIQEWRRHQLAQD